MIPVRTKCRPAPCPLFNRVPPRAVPSTKSWTTTRGIGQQVRMFHRPFHFVRNESVLKDALFPSSSSAVPAANNVER